MKKIVFALGLILMAAKCGYSQNIHYKVLEDDPYAIKRLVLHIDPFYCDFWPTDITLGWGLRADLHYGSLGTLNIDFRHSYLDVVQTSNKEDKEIKKYTWFESVASINLMDKTKSRSMKITLSSSSHTSGGYTYTSEKYFMAPGTKRKITSLRGGIYFVNTPYEAYDAGAFSVSSTDTLRPVVNAAAMMKTMTIVGGISFKSITNLLVSVDDWGNRRNAGYMDFYIDALFAPGVGMGKCTVEHPVTSVQTPKADLDILGKKNLGWRMGWSYKHPIRSWLSYKFEFGSRPGYKEGKGILASNAFMLIGMGWSIPFKTRF